MSKKLIIMTAAAGLVSFAGAFAFTWLTRKPAPSQGQSPALNQSVLAGQETDPRWQQAGLGAGSSALGSRKAGSGAGTDSVVGVQGGMKKTMTEKQLKSLVYEVREKIREYNNKLQSLEVQEQRLQMAADMIKKDVEELNKLQIELTSAVAGLKRERDKLLKSRIEVAKAEKVNLISIAATYDKMDAASAGKILTNMSQMQTGELGGDSFNDAVKILHYMTARTKAKLLAELVTSEPKLAAVLSRRLKQIVEEQ